MSSVPIPHEPPPPALPKTSRHHHLDTYRLNRERLYPNVTDEQWNDWKWQQKNRVTSLEQITELFSFDEVTSARLPDIFELYRTAITPYYLCLIDFDNPNDPLRLQSVPTVEELLNPGELTWDPLNEEGDSPVHRPAHEMPGECLTADVDPARGSVAAKEGSLSRRARLRRLDREQLLLRRPGEVGSRPDGCFAVDARVRVRHPTRPVVRRPPPGLPCDRRVTCCRAVPTRG